MSDDEQRNSTSFGRSENSRNDDDQEEGVPSDEGSGDDIDRAGSMDDSSEEDEDEDEEEQRRVAEGFIVDDEEEGEGEGEDDDAAKARKHKRKRRALEAQEGLDEDDLDLLEENTGFKRRTEPKFKRLKRRTEQEKPRDLEAIFDEDEQPEQEEPMQGYDEMDDFIEQDESDDEREARIVRPRGPRAARPEVAGINPEQWDEIYEIFGDGGEYADALEEDEDELTEKKETQLKDVFEPSEIVERFLTEDDDHIRMRDIPERMQIRHAASSDKKLEDREIEEETTWVVKVLSKDRRMDEYVREPFKNAVKNVLTYMSQEFLEVPFIWAHRRDYTIYVDSTNQSIDLLSHDDLWTIQDLDFKYRSFLDRRAAVRTTYEKLELSDDYFEDLFRSAETIDDVANLSEYITYKYSKEIREANQRRANGYKKPVRSSIYERARNTAVMDFVKAFGINAQEFATNVHEGNRRHFAEDPEALPVEHAEKFIVQGTEFSSADAVLHAAHDIIAQELGVDLQLRREVRFIYQNQGRISVMPTEKGITEISETHPYNAFKYLYQKPVAMFDNTVQILQIIDAEQHGLVEVSVGIADEGRIFKGLLDLYTSDGFSAVAQAWNEERSSALRTALDKHLYPYAGRWLRERLRQDAEDWLAGRCGDTLEQRINMAPYKPRGLDRGNVPRVLSVSWGHGDPMRDAIMAVYMDENGRVLDQTKFNNLRDEEYRAELAELLERRRPDVVAIAGFSVGTHWCRQQVAGIIETLNASEPLDVEIIYVNDDVARIYHTSKRGLEEYGDLPPMARYCVALARYTQSPLHEYASLGKDLLAITFDTWQKFVPEEKLMDRLERALINVVNATGVDINDAIQKQYRSSVLQYVCGLGSRKVTSIVKRINSYGGHLATRAELITRGIITSTVFVNCASFIRIPQDDVQVARRDDIEPDVLDDTRIHPEDYELARKMAADALELDEEDLQDYHNKSDVVKQLMKDEGVGLDQLILEDYAFELERVTRQQKRVTLHTIKEELQSPYADKRAEFRPPGTMEVFTMLTGETPQTLQPGFIVPATVRNVRQSMAYVRLDSGIEGEISYQNVSDDPSFSHVTDMLSPGQTIQARVLEIDYEQFRCQLSTRKSDVLPGDADLRLVRPDVNFDEEAWQRDQDKLALSRQKSEVKATRVIQHPLFKALNSRQAEHYLESLHRGDVVIRPSSKGNDHLVVTWKIDDGVYQHIDVLELDKDNEFSLGRTLKVGGKFTYSDLDELIVSHVQAMARKVDEMLNHEKFKRGTKDDLETFLNNALLANPNRAAYAFGLDKDHPGYFHLAFKTGPRDSISTWSVKVIPGGFSLRDTVYADMQNLCNGFKIRIATMQAQQKSAAQPPPRRQPQSDYRGYGGSGGGGWQQPISNGWGY